VKTSGNRGNRAVSGYRPDNAKFLIFILFILYYINQLMYLARKQKKELVIELYFNQNKTYSEFARGKDVPSGYTANSGRGKLTEDRAVNL
jgi:type IV secretory pathway VirB9-like protein